VLIRAARPDDLSAIVSLIEGGALEGAPSPPFDLERCRQALKEIEASGNEVLVADDDDVVIGTCQLIVFRLLQHNGGRCAEIESMHVAKDHRSQGVGGSLLAAAIERARDLGCYRVQLTSNEQRQSAHRFYVRHGFVASHVGFKLTL